MKNIRKEKFVSQSIYHAKKDSIQNFIKKHIMKNKSIELTSNFNKFNNISEAVDREKIQNEYWDFMLDGEYWDLSVDGLLNFIIDSFYEINSRYTREECIIEATTKIKEKLSSLLKVIKLLEKELELNLG